MNKAFLFFFITFCFVKIFGQNISVDPTYTAQELVQNVLFSNTCGTSTISNVSVSGANFSTTDQSWGYFNANGSTFPFQEGIILSTGKINNAVGPNTSLSDDDASNWNGDADLNQALSISNSINATILEFDFVPMGNTIAFDYIFASEEYHGTASCNYSDGFAFLLKEVGTSTYENLAVLPNTSIPVKVTSVHPENSACAAQNEEYFDTYNDGSSPINYNGQTVALTASATVTSGTTYHIKLVIADEGNYRYDSAIFLQGGSFNFGIDLGDDQTFANENPICYNENFTLDATDVSATTYTWYSNDVIMTGENNATLNFSPPYTSGMNAAYKVVIDEGLSCEREGEIELEFAEELIVNENSYTICDTDNNADGITTFTTADETTIINQLFTNLTNQTIALFANENDTDPIVFPFENTTANQQIIYAKVTNSSCYTSFPVTLYINSVILQNPTQTIGICNNTPTQLQAESGSSYLWNTGETSSSITITSAGTYSVEITSTNSCTATQTFTVINSEMATIEGIIINDFNTNNTAEIIVSGNGNYSYSLDGTNYQEGPIFQYLEEGEYTVFVTDENGCGSVSESFYILNHPKFFTPNGDGINDYWNIKNLNKRNLSTNKIYIFDRYGKLIKQINSESSGWNGTFNGQHLPATDYWFILELTTGKTIKGHFSLLR